MNGNFRMLCEEVLDLIYPRALYCICCGKIIDGSRPYRLCNRCMADIRWASEEREVEYGRNQGGRTEDVENLRTCRKCGKILSRNNPTDRCYSCREHDHLFDMGFTCCEYGMNPRSMLFALKYHGRTDIGITIAEVMGDRIEQIRRETGLLYDAILPVPMNPEKEKQRGYNQASVIGRRLAALEGVPYLDKVLRRTRNTAPLRGMTPAERRQVLAGTMEVIPGAEEEIRRRDLLLVDDIYTTGSTMDAAAEVLLAAGAERVYIFTFAAGADVIKSE